MDYLLHIDTSANKGTVAISKDGELVAHKESNDTRNYVSVINVMINETLAEAGISLQQISAFVVCAGPGSYTGLRIGLSTAKAFCYLFDKPLILINKLTLFAFQEINKNSEYDFYLSILFARDKEYFISLYDNNFNCIVEPKHVMQTQLYEIIGDHRRILIIGNANSDDIPLLSEKITFKKTEEIDLKSMIVYGFIQFKSKQNVNLSLAEPFYLKQVYTNNNK